MADAPTEKELRYKLSDMIAAIEPTFIEAAKPKVYPYPIPPVGNLLSSYKDLVVDENNDINVIFISLANLDGDKNDVQGFQQKSADIYQFEFRFFRGIVADKKQPRTQIDIVAYDQFASFIKQMVKVFDDDNTAQTYLGFHSGVSHGALRTVQSMPPWGKLGAYDVYASVLGLDVMASPC